MAVLKVTDIIEQEKMAKACDCAHWIRMCIFAFDHMHAKVLAHEEDLSSEWDEIADALNEFKKSATGAGFKFPEPKNMTLHGSRLEYPNVF